MPEQKFNTCEVLSCVHAPSHNDTCLAVSNSSIFVQMNSAPSIPKGGDRFGQQLAFSRDGNTMAACANTYNRSVVNVYKRLRLVCPVYVRNTVTGTWRALSLVPFYTQLSDVSNRQMAFSSDATTLVMAATHYPFIQDNNGRQWVQAKIYVRNVAGNYVFQKLLRQEAVSPLGPDGPAGQSGFGIESVSISLSADGNYLALGAAHFNEGTGGAWVYSRQNGEWLQPSKILLGSGAKGLASGRRLRSGRRVAISGNGQVLAVASCAGIGTVWIFSRTGNTWSETDKLTGGTDWVLEDNNGDVDLSFDGKTLAFGGNVYGGSFMVFRNVNRVWLRTEISSTGTFDKFFFGVNVELSDDGRTVVVASESPQPVVFFFQNGMWVQDGDHSPKRKPSEYRRTGVYTFAISGDGATIAVKTFDIDDITFTGIVKIYKRPSL